MKIYGDTPTRKAVGFQDPGSQWKLGIIDLHDNIIFYLIILLVIILWFFLSSFFNADHLANLHHGNLIEIVWTITPAKILWVIGLPSLKLLYKKDEILDPELTVKAIASQWFWTYEYSDNEEVLTTDSFKVSDSDLELGE